MLNDNASLMEQNKQDYSLFYDKVKPGGDWDYKRNENGREYYFFDGQLVGSESFGNLHYGYVGTAGGFCRGELIDAPGFVQESPRLRDIGTNFDDPEDTNNINQGVNSYNSSHNNASTFSANLKGSLYKNFNGPLYSRIAGLAWFTGEKIINYFNK